MIRRCKNCKNWQQETKKDENSNTGFCKLNPMLFAFTLEKTVFPITKDFYLCTSHEFDNESYLEKESKSILLKDAIKKKEDVK